MHSFFEFKEAVIHTENYTDIIEGKLEQLISYIPLNDTIENILNFLNKIFNSFNIKFEVLKEEGISKSGILKAKTLNDSFKTIIIYCTNDFNVNFRTKLNFLKFIEKFLIILSHELVHRGQFLLMQKHIHLKGNQFLDSEDLKYYSNKYELMAFANMIIEELRFSKKTNNDILQGIKNNLFTSHDSEFLNFYTINFTKKGDKILNQLYNYIFQYIKEPIKIDL